MSTALSLASAAAPARTPAVRPRQRVEETPLVAGAQLYELPRITDARGHLSFAEIHQALPFPVMRYFLVFGVPSREIRGEHAHRRLGQFLVCVHGSCSVRLFDGDASEEVLLNRPDLGMHIPPMVWTTEYQYSADAVLLVLASDVYREDDYIRDLDEYLALKGEGHDALS
jgi:UDP-2-acetamido-3-amino-2,3-dideoxy-glucuronate N-acetyltransferase